MSSCVSGVSYVSLRWAPTCCLAYGNRTSATKEIGVVVPSMSRTITGCGKQEIVVVKKADGFAYRSVSLIRLNRKAAITVPDDCQKQMQPHMALQCVR
jgi:hypothetical protein